MIKAGDKVFKSIWFGNFYRPAFDDENFVKNTIALLKDTGFTSVLLDSKAWEDFRIRFEGGKASDYVRMQEYMEKTCLMTGMSYEFLSLYLNGDNLYPNIRFSPPIRGESIINRDGADGKWYRYWSVKAKDAMTEHVRGLVSLYGDEMTEVKGEAVSGKPMVSMWDPVVAPSFDEDGRERYVSYLKGIYDSIDDLNEAYGTSYSSFDEPSMSELWAEGTPSCKTEMRKRYDNRRWQRDELVLYFREMKERLHGIDPSLLLVPDLTQWGYFLTLDGVSVAGAMLSDLWDTANRGIDLYRLSGEVDITHFISVPVTPKADAEAYVTGYHHSMMRVMNRGRDFLGGIYFGRYLYNNIYRTLTTSEIIGTIAASGAGGYYAYGVCGLDDGGLLHRMDEPFLEDLKAANRWLDRVLPITGRRMKSEAALMFPSAMALAEDFSLPGSEERRLDSLGWYRFLSDYGINTDVTDLKDFTAHRSDYSLLILPEDSMYAFERDEEGEEALRAFVRDGGTLIHSPGSCLAGLAFGIVSEEEKPSPVCFSEKALITTTMYVSYPDGDVIASYSLSGRPALVKREYGKGNIISVGFDFGLSYGTKTIPHVPLEEKNNELYPLSLIRECPLAPYIERALGRNIGQERDIEVSFFDNGYIIVNHRSYPYTVSREGKVYGIYNDSYTVPPHGCAFVEKITGGTI